jgi:Uma2 family endonuclease
MATAVSSHPVEAIPERILLHDMSWQAYETLLHEIGDRNIRLTYDEGRLEIMSSLPEHESPKKLIGAFIDILSLEMRIPMRRLGSATFKRQDLAKGLEPDECYYIQNESRVRGKRTLDLALDPPPDLAVEIDISYRGIRRESIYAALGVPELWRYDGFHLFGLHLDTSGHYQRIENSVAFPFLRLSELERFLKPEPTTDETSLLLGFRDWARANFVNPGSI